MADGSIIIDTKIDEKGAQQGVKELKSAIEQLTKSIQILSTSITTSFNGIHNAAAKAAVDAGSLSDSYKDAQKSAEDLRKEAENIKIDRGEDLENKNIPQKTAMVDPNNIGYDKAAVDFVNQYVKGAEKAVQSTNEFKNEIGRLKEKIKELEGNGLYFGDEEYDEIYLKLQKVSQALKDYKKELTSPTPNANPFGLNTMSGQIVDLQSKLQKLIDTGRNFGDEEFDKAYLDLQKVKQALKDYKKELVSPTPNANPFGLNTMQGQIFDLQGKLKKLMATGKNFGDEEFDKAYLDLEKMKQALKDYKKELTSPTPNANPFGLNTMQGQIVDLQNRLKKLTDSGKGLGDAQYDEVYVKLAKAKEAAKEYASELTKIQNTEPKPSIFDGLISKLSVLAKKARSVVSMFGKMVASNIANGIKKISSGILGIHKTSNKSTISIGKLLKYLFGIRSLYVLFNKLRSALVDGFKNLAQYSGSTNGVISGLISSLTQLKNSFATAFAPILTAVAPALNYLISLLNSAVTAIAQFMAALTGQKTFTKATKVQQNYAESLKKTGGAAKEAKGELASFDKLNVQKDEDSGRGGGGDGASPADMFETAEIESRFKQMADKIKGFIKSEDWSGLGAYMADGINAGLQKIYDAINWDNVGPKITYFVNAFTETFNSLVDNIDWDLLGRTLGAGLNTLVNTLLLFVDGIDWKNLGAKLAIGANSLVDEIDWWKLGRLFIAKFNILAEMLDGFFNGNGDSAGFDFLKLGISLGNGINGAIDSIDPHVWAGALGGAVKGLIDTLVGTLAGVDWQEIGTKIAEFIGSIDYGGILASLVRGIGPVFGAIGGIIIGLLKPGWNAAVTWWKETAFKDGQFTMQGLRDGINKAWADIKTWVKEHIFQPFIDGFKLAFGIHSPSTVMAEMGGYLMDGLINKITDMIPNLIAKITDIKTKMSEKWDEVKENASEKWDDIKKTISEKWDKIKEDSGTKVDEFKKKVSDAWDSLGKKTSNIWNGIWDTINGVIKKISGIGSNIWNGLTGGSLGISEYSLQTSVPSVASVSLPHLASGTVVPPRAGEFAAILGDNKRETEVVSPLSTIKKAMIEALQAVGMTDNSGDIVGHIYLDGKELGNSTVKFVRQETKRTGKNPVLV
nr:MAG TPA: minor tail protein [Caudoviricetes sp.]